MNIYNIKMENLTYTRGYYGNMPEEMFMNMQQKMQYDYMVNQLAWHYLEPTVKAQHILTNSAEYRMHMHWDMWMQRESNK